MTEKDAEEFRKQAEECRRMAAEARCEIDREAWLSLADDWIRLAQGTCPTRKS